MTRWLTSKATDRLIDPQLSLLPENLTTTDSSSSLDILGGQAWRPWSRLGPAGGPYGTLLDVELVWRMNFWNPTTFSILRGRWRPRGCQRGTPKCRRIFMENEIHKSMRAHPRRPRPWRNLDPRQPPYSPHYRRSLRPEMQRRSRCFPCPQNEEFGNQLAWLCRCNGGKSSTQFQLWILVCRWWKLQIPNPSWNSKSIFQRFLPKNKTTWFELFSQLRSTKKELHKEKLL